MENLWINCGKLVENFFFVLYFGVEVFVSYVDGCLLFVAGAVGSLVRQLVADNRLVLPRRLDGQILLGFVGGMVVGGFVGLVLDGSFVAAALSGYVGIEAIARLLPRSAPADNKKEVS